MGNTVDLHKNYTPALPTNGAAPVANRINVLRS